MKSDLELNSRWLSFERSTTKLNKPLVCEFAMSQDLEQVKTLGTGAYGVVTLVRSKVTGRFYALKRLLKRKIKRLKQEKVRPATATQPAASVEIEQTNEVDSFR